MQILLDRGFGAAGVAINPAPTEGVPVVPVSQVRATFPVLKNPANRHRALGFTHEQWHYAFANTFDGDESRALYERYAIPASGRIVWGSALANLEPATRTPTSTTTTTTAGHCCSSRAPKTTSCPRRCSGRTRSTTSRTASPRSWSSAAERICFPPRPAGRRSCAGHVLLPTAGVVVTTVAGAERPGGNALGSGGCRSVWGRCGRVNSGSPAGRPSPGPRRTWPRCPRASRSGRRCGCRCAAHPRPC